MSSRCTEIRCQTPGRIKKRIISCVLAVLCFLLSIGPNQTVMAEGTTYQIIINNAIAGETYTAYKIFDATDANPDGGTYVKTTDTSVNASKTYYTRNTDSTTGAVTYSAVSSPSSASLSNYYELRSGVAYTISIDNPWYSTIQTYANDSKHGLSISNGIVTATSDFSAADFAKALKAYLDSLSETTTPKKSKIAAAATATASGTGNGGAKSTVTLTVPSAGYYFVDTSLGELVALDTASRTVNMYEKNSTPTVVKEISFDDVNWVQRTAGSDPTITANIGNVPAPVYYRLTINTGMGTDSAITIHDKMDAGLSIDPGSFYISTDDTGENATNTYRTVKVNSSARRTQDSFGFVQNGSFVSLSDDCTFEIEFTEDYIKSLADNTTITILYNADLNDSAKVYYKDVQTDTNDNIAWLTYSNQTTPESRVKTRTFAFQINKVDENGNAMPFDASVADNVKFELTMTDKWNVKRWYRSVHIAGDNVDSVWGTSENKMTVDSSGHILFTGLAAGTYLLTETDTKDGYNKLADTITVTVAEDGSVTAYYTSRGSADGAITVEPASKEGNVVTPARFTIMNKAGAVLPSTGGIGTTIFYIIGGVFVALSAAVLIARRRRKLQQ